jgi:hypothetical protein
VVRERSGVHLERRSGGERGLERNRSYLPP